MKDFIAKMAKPWTGFRTSLWLNAQNDDCCRCNTMMPYLNKFLGHHGKNETLYCIAETAKANNLNPYQYFKYLLEEIPKECKIQVNK